MVVSRKLYEDTCPHCGGNHPQAEASLPAEYVTSLPAEIQKLLLSIYNKGKSNNIFSIQGSLLSSIVYDSFKRPGVDFTTPDAVMLTRLTRDVWQFSAAKNYQELRDITDSLKDDNGSLRTTSDFINKASTICDKYDRNWFTTEYNFATASSQNAARYIDFTRDKDIIPFLEYQTVGDAQVRDSHALLDGIIKNIDNPWWSTHYPPNGWGCRCEVIQAPGVTSESKETPVINIPPMFRTNLAATGLIFPKNHPYYNGVPRSEIRKSILYLPPKNTYMDIVLGNNELEIHPLHGEKELQKNINACNTLLNLDPSAKIKMLPVIGEKDSEVKKSFYPGAYLKKFPSRNADILYNNSVVEIEISNGSKSSLQNAVKRGKIQSDFIMIEVPEDANFNEVDRVINGQLKYYEGKHNLSIWTFNSKGKRKYTTKQKE